MVEVLRSFRSILGDTEAIERAQQDCVASFNCRSLSSESANYSTGSTYFIKANEKPGCHLEALAQQIFKQHTVGVDFDANNSGAEWWSQAIDARDDIGFHWDRDYGAEEERGEHIYPFLGTVTYLSKEGGPTLVVEKAGTGTEEEPPIGSAQRLSVSRPVVGKHIVFKGDLLHAAPSDLKDDDAEDEEDSEESGSEDGSESGPLRITFLVNVWINHIPSQSKRLPKKDQKALSPVDEKLVLQFGKPAEPKEVSLTRADCSRTRTWVFNNSDINFEVKVPLPSLERTEELLAQDDSLMLTYVSARKGATAEFAGHGVEILFSEHQPSDSDSDGDSEGGEQGNSGSEEEEGSEDSEVGGEGEESEEDGDEEPAAQSSPAKKRRF